MIADRRIRPFDMLYVETKSERLRTTRQKKQQNKQQIKDLSFLYTNATSLVNKMDEFKVTCEYFNPDIIGITETWFRSNFNSSSLGGYNEYRRDRNDGRRRWCCVVCREPDHII